MEPLPQALRWDGLLKNNAHQIQVYLDQGLGLFPHAPDKAHEQSIEEIHSLLTE